MTSVSFRSVTKRFGAVDALKGLDLDIDSGEFVSLLGPSGSGKTTSLNLLAGLLTVDEGEIWIGDRCVNQIPPERRDIGIGYEIDWRLSRERRRRGQRQPRPRSLPQCWREPCG